MTSSSASRPGATQQQPGGCPRCRQFVGVGDDSITLSGWIAPELMGTYWSIAALRAMGDMGQPFALVAERARCSVSSLSRTLSETGTLHKKDGTPRRIAFDLTLTRVDDDQGGDRVTVNDQGQFSGSTGGQPTLDSLL